MTITMKKVSVLGAVMAAALYARQFRFCRRQR